MAGALQELDKVLNPAISGGSVMGLIIDVSGIKKMLGRGLVVLIGVGIMYLGFKRLTGDSSGLTGNKGLLGIVTENRRISQLQTVERGNVTRAQQRADTEAAKIREQRLRRLQQNRQFKATQAAQDATKVVPLVLP